MFAVAIVLVILVVAIGVLGSADSVRGYEAPPSGVWFEEVSRDVIVRIENGKRKGE